MSADISVRSGKPGPAPIPRDTLLTSVSAAFAERGFAAASMRGIAEHAGVTKPTLYAHFGGKEALYVACIAYEAGLCTEHLFAAYARAESLSVDEEIAADIHTLFDYARQRPDGFRLLFDVNPAGPATSHRSELIDTVMSRIARQIARRTKLDADSEPVRQFAAMAVGTAIFSVREVLSAASDQAAAARLATSFVAGGLRNLH